MKSNANPKGSAKRRVRKRMLKSSDIEALIEQVRLRPILWNERVPLRSSPSMLKLAWDEVAAALQQDAQACKSTWSSLRASLRYRRKNALHDWEHTEALSFLSVNVAAVTNKVEAQAQAEAVAEAQAEGEQVVMIAVAGRVIHKYSLGAIATDARADNDGADARASSNSSSDDPFKDVDFNLLLSLDANANAANRRTNFEFERNQ